MKKSILTSLATAVAIAAFSQADLKEAQKYITVPGGVQNVDKKVLKGPDPQFMPYMALKFRTGTSKTEKAQGADVKATAWAVLDGLDSTTFQEITNEFYKNFTAKMKAAGVSYAELDKIKSSKSFPKFSEEPEPRHYNHKTFGTADVFTPYNVSFFKYPAAVMKVMKWQNEIEAALSTLRLTVNFVDFDINVSQDEGVISGNYITYTTSANAKVAAMARLEFVFQESTWESATTGSYYNGAGLVMSNMKLFAAAFNSKSIAEPCKATIKLYDNKSPEFASKKFRAFQGDVVFGTYVITIEPQEYKRAVLKALDRYTDYVVAIVKSYNVEK